ncbi:MAG TPA: GNAT family N-acetyltransferase [Ktedonobacterales bacterium]|nr:GNAT family N-acetyltransferase [Ktedonobacterales bacterium]
MTQRSAILQPVLLPRVNALVLLRLAQPDDDERLRRMFFRLSAVTRYQWFFIGAPGTPQWAERVAALAAADEDERVTVVALMGDEIVGVAHLDRTRSDGRHAEIGVLLEDAWQGRGLGSLLARRLATEAMQRQTLTLTARTLAENHSALRLMLSTFIAAHAHYDQGEYDIVAPLAAWEIMSMWE